MGIQDIAVGLLALGALWYLVRFMRSSVKDHDCGDCIQSEATAKKKTLN